MDGSRAAAVARLLAVAGGQAGVVLHPQLASAGMSRRHAEALRRDGWLVPVRPGAYVVGRAAPTEWQMAVSASLLSGPGTVLSHFTAARCHGFEVVGDGRPDLTVVAPRQPRLSEVHLHRVARLDPCDVEPGRDGTIVTAAPRTIVDLAPKLSLRSLAHVLDEAMIGRKLHVSAVQAALERTGPRPGTRVLRGLLAERGATGDGVESHLELKVLRALEGLGPFEKQHVVTVGRRLYRLDLARTDLCLAVESDGWAVRSRSRTKFDRDRRRDNDLAAAGWSVVHLTSVMSAAEMRAAVVAVMLRAAERRGAGGR